MARSLYTTPWWRYEWWKGRRHIFFSWGVAVLMLLIEGRLFYLQILENTQLAKRSRDNRIRVEIVPPPRGRIFDRNGVLVANNAPIYSLYAVPSLINRNPQTLNQLCELLFVDEARFRKSFSRSGAHSYYPIPIMRDIDFDIIARVSVSSVDLPGIFYDKEMTRIYSSSYLPHVVGRVGEPSAEESYSRTPGIMVGKSGLEWWYEVYLSGYPGAKFVEVDALGRRLSEATDIDSEDPIPGWDLYLNIDCSLQEMARQLMGDNMGAVVLMDPRDGAVLAMVSTPDYDPNIFSGQVPYDVWEGVNADPRKPLLNRAIQGVYPPGSTFKLAILAGALEEGLIGDNFTTHCSGGMTIGNRFFRCWRKAGHGTLNWAGGLQQSCDVFFYTLGIKLGVERISHYAQILGLGAKTGIDLPGEYQGKIPSAQYLRTRYGKWAVSAGSAANLAIGQGEILVTPIQLAVYTGAMATGLVVKPRIAQFMTNPLTGEVRKVVGEYRPVKLSTGTLHRLREAMRLVVNEPGGTAYRQRRSDIVIAGKTGTAQNPHGEDHALFIAYAPFDDPIVVGVAVVENGGHGSSVAAPIVCQLIEYYLYNLYPGPRSPRENISAQITHQSREESQERGLEGELTE